jgi:hypothetical protein
MFFPITCSTYGHFPNGRQQTLYTLKVGEAIQFAETSEGQLLTTCFKKIFINVQSNKDI